MPLIGTYLAGIDEDPDVAAQQALLRTTVQRLLMVRAPRSAGLDG